MDINKQIIVTSTSKAIDYTKINGNMNLDKVSLYSLYFYYMNFSKDKQLLVEDYNTLKNNLFKLKYMFPEEICNYKTFIGYTSTTTPINIKPTVVDIIKDLGSNDSYSFLVTDFTSVFTDLNGDLPVNIKITNINSSNVKLYYNGILAPSLFEIPISETNKLKLVRNDFNVITQEIGAQFRISDYDDFSNLANILVEASSSTVEGNKPATIGDNAISVGNRVITTLTLAMFTSSLTPPYNDPEGDLIDAIRIDEISTANVGKFLFNNAEVSEGQIITREDLALNLFTHSGANVSTVETDAINFSARDEGSLIWVN